MLMETTYNLPLIFLSVFVAIFASYVALNLAYSVTQAKGKSQLVWLACGSIAMGFGIWSMHFVGMLAFEMPGMEMAYDVPLMVLSVVVAILGSGLALYVVSRPKVTSKSIGISGFAMAIAICGMHYIGMFSMRMAATIDWNLWLVAASFLIALVASYGALTISYRLRHTPEKLSLLILASVIMGFAIAGMHYTGMLAAKFIHDHSVIIADSNLLVTSGLSVATITTTLLILGIALAGSVGQRMLTHQQQQSDEILDKSEERFRVLVEAVKDYAIFMIDPTGYITTWNSGAEKIIGYSAHEVIGKHLSVLYTEIALTNTADKELAVAKREGHFEAEAVRKRKDGKTFWANIVIDPLYDKDGKLTGFSKVIRDITQFKEAAERTKTINEELEQRVQERTLELQEREAQLRTITNAIPNLIAQADRSEKILFANNSFCDWFGVKLDEVQGLNLLRVLKEEHYKTTAPYIMRALEGETVSFERESKNGNQRVVLNITFVPEFDNKDQIKGFIIVGTDVSNYKLIEEELKRAKEGAEVANATKSAFLANMSHEIRTPLGAILGFSELMLDGDMSPNEKQRTLEIIKRNGKLLSNIINDILDLSKVEAGKMVIERVDVQLRELMNEISVLLNLEAAGKGIQLRVSSEGVVPQVIKTDPTRLRQILFNIVGNAIKFTEKGYVSLKVKLSSENPKHIQFIIEDTGTGISPDQTSRLFSPFTQADVTTTRKFGGTGLGLVLAKKFANALGGDVVLAHSEVGRGSTFIISIDHGQSQEVLFESTLHNKTVVSGAGTEAPKLASLNQMRVLIVDDSPDNLALVQRILKIAGAQVEIADNGKDGIEKAIHGDFDVVLMDLQMPIMDGYEVTQVLRDKGYRKPIVALTAHAMKEERRRTLESGFDEHLTKPIDRYSLISVLNNLRGQSPNPGGIP